MGAEGLEVWDDKLLPEGLSEQNNVALDTPETGDKTTSGQLVLALVSDWASSPPSSCLSVAFQDDFSQNVRAIRRHRYSTHDSNN